MNRENYSSSIVPVELEKHLSRTSSLPASDLRDISPSLLLHPVSPRFSSTVGAHLILDSRSRQLLNQTKLIIWDEAPAQHRYCFEAVDRTLRDIRKTNSWFGGITVVFAGTSSAASISNISIGDFRQCLPVIPGGSRGQITNAAISNASFWKDTTIMRLTVNMRLLAQARHMSLDQQHYTQDFAAWLLNVGNGSINEENNVNLPRSTCPLCFLS